MPATADEKGLQIVFVNPTATICHYLEIQKESDSESRVTR